MTQSHIHIVEDDLDISAPLASFLHGMGFSVSTSVSVEAADEFLLQNKVDLILLDRMLPGKDGLDLCRRLRSLGGPSIIMVTALAEPSDIIDGLELGADDYVSKPFDLNELLARIRAVLRRTPKNFGQHHSSTWETTLRFSNFVFYPYRRFVRSPTGLRVPLTGAETDLLLIFCRRANQVLSREQLISLTRGEGFAISTRSIDLLVSRLRRKLTGNDQFNDLIRTLRADGYMFQTSVTIDE